MTVIDNLVHGLVLKQLHATAEAQVPSAKGSKNSASGYRGVYYYPRNNTWRVTFRNKFYGFFATIEEAVARRANIVALAPKKARKPRKHTKEQIRYASMHAEHQVLRARYRKLLAQPVSLSAEARHVFEEEYEAIRLKYYPKVSHAPKDLSSWEARRIAFEEENEHHHQATHELKRVPPNIVFPEYLGLSAKGQIANLRAQYRKSVADTTLSDAERQHLRQLLSFHIARVNAPKF